MTINYALFENNLTSDPDDYMALVQPTGTAGQDAIIDRMMQRGSTVTKADIFSVLEDYFSAIEEMVLEGMNANTPSANYGASIKGVFNGPNDSFDAGRHQIRATVSPGQRLRVAVSSRAQPSKQEPGKPSPTLMEYMDYVGGERNSTLTPAGMGQISGHRLKFDPNDENQGIFFVAADGNTTRVEVVGQNKPATLMFMVPGTLAAGEYTLEVRAAVYGGNEIRKGELPATVTVS